MALTTIANVVIGEFDVTIVDFNGNQSCSVKLLPYGPFLFRSSIEWLKYSGNLEDGDATHKVEPAIIDKLAAWAESNGYVIQPW